VFRPVHFHILMLRMIIVDVRINTSAAVAASIAGRTVQAFMDPIVGQSQTEKRAKTSGNPVPEYAPGTVARWPFRFARTSYSASQNG
jgi:hypothetical protein